MGFKNLRETNKYFVLQDIPKINGIFQIKLLEIAESLQLSRNIMFALLALQSWKAFVSNWMNSVSNILDLDSCSSDHHSNVAMSILKVHIFWFIIFHLVYCDLHIFDNFFVKNKRRLHENWNNEIYTISSSVVRSGILHF